MKAQIVTIGDEILIGQTLDTNSAWLASKLTEIGFIVSSMTSIADNATDIKEAINRGFVEYDLLIFTGGLGPTKDDITKNSLCDYFSTNLEFNNDVYSDVVAFLKQRGAKMNPLNRNQALFPKGAELLRNKQGTAPGIWFEQNNKVLVSLPGVPWEMKGIFNAELKNKLKAKFKLSNSYYQTIIVSGIGESPLALKLQNWEEQLPNIIKLAYLPSPGIVKLRLGVIGLNNEEAVVLVKKEVKKLYDIIPEYLVSDFEVSLQEIVVNKLKISHKTVSTAESCTGGSIAKLITEIPGSSTVFKGGIVAYANEIKNNLLGVNLADIEKYGAVSQQVVEQMAIGIKEKFNTSFAIATSGIAGPDGGSNEKPVGTVWIAVAGSETVTSKRFLFGNDRILNIKRSANAALNMLIKELGI